MNLQNECCLVMILNEPIFNQRPLRQQTQILESSAKVGIIGSMYPHVVKGTAPGEGGGSPPPQAEGGSQKTNQMKGQMRKRMRKRIRMKKQYP